MFLIKVFRLGDIMLILLSLRANKITEPSDCKKCPSLPPHPQTHSLVNSPLLGSDNKLKGGGD